MSTFTKLTKHTDSFTNRAQAYPGVYGVARYGISTYGTATAGSGTYTDTTKHSSSFANQTKH